MSEIVPGTALGAGLNPLQAQAVYRAVLDAFARPGTIRLLPRTAYPSALLSAMSLADLETGTHLLEAPGEEWTSVLATATGAPQTSLRDAKFVTALRPLTDDELGEVSVGTPLSPESGATVIIAVDSVRGGDAVRLTGPGVPQPIEFAPHGISTGIWETRERLVSAFPTGVDLLFVGRDGDLVGIPRTTVVDTLVHTTPTAKAN